MGIFTNEQLVQVDNFIRKEGTKFVFRCLYCRKSFAAPGYEARYGRMTKYCSNLCQATSPERRKNTLEATKKVDRYGSNNSNYRDGAYLYKNFLQGKCELCSRSKDITGRKRKRRYLIVHHCDKNRRNSSPDNLRTVCYSCHRKIHASCYYGKYPDFQMW